jgi:hypothetical protein
MSFKFWRTGKPRSGIERDPTINEKGGVSRTSTYDYDTIEILGNIDTTLKLMLLHLQSMTGEEFKEDDTKDII